MNNQPTNGLGVSAGVTINYTEARQQELTNSLAELYRTSPTYSGDTAYNDLAELAAINVALQSVAAAQPATQPAANELEAALSFGKDKTLDSHPAWGRIQWGVNILREMSVRRLRYDLTQKQVEFAIKLHKESLEKLANHEAGSERKAELLAAGVAVPTGRVEVTGVVEKIKVVDTDYGRQTKVIVGLTNGTRVWGTLPNSNGRTEVGSRVTFVGTFVVSHDDPFFGFYSRPAKWVKHEEEVQNA